MLRENHNKKINVCHLHTAMILRHLNAIFTFVFLNRFVFLRVCWDIRVNVAPFFVFVHVCVWCCVFCLLWRLYFCNILGGKQSRCAVWRIVSHSLLWRSGLSGRLGILSM